MDKAEIRVAGVTLRVPFAEIAGRTVVVSGRWLRMAAIKDEDFQEGELVNSPREFVDTIKEKRVGADIFTFSQKLTDSTPRFPYFYELDSVAALQVRSFQDWWENRVSSDLRKDVRRAAKRGVVSRVVAFDDDFVRGVVNIYNETPVRQGRPFWHYRKSFEIVKEETGTYPERSTFVGAFLENELIGFLKIVSVDQTARLMQIISSVAHQDKRVTNALIAKAAEICDQKRWSYLTYGKYRYGGVDSSLTAFKHRNGFQEILVPKYYVPLTLKGAMALRLHLQHGAVALVPPSIKQSLRSIRSLIYNRSLSGHSLDKGSTCPADDGVHA